jgi:hypothetical protein
LFQTGGKYLEKDPCLLLPQPHSRYGVAASILNLQAIQSDVEGRKFLRVYDHFFPSTVTTLRDVSEQPRITMIFWDPYCLWSATLFDMFKDAVSGNYMTGKNMYLYINNKIVIWYNFYLHFHLYALMQF